MDKSLATIYYSRPEIAKAIMDFAKDREIAIKYKNSYFGKRPDVIEYLSDIRSMVEQGATSFHCSEERWANPLLLGNSNLNEEEKTKNRTGWDLILDLDGVDFEYAKIVGKIIIEFLNEIGVKNISIKFSGNKGFHIGIPFEAFSSNIIGIGETRTLFPQVARKIATYLMVELKGRISKALLELEGTIENIAKKHNLQIQDLINNDKDSLNFDFMKVIEIDTILISSRHLFRMPYSLNEKSELASIPLENEKIMEFQKEWAKPLGINPDFHKDYSFLKYDSKYGRDADVLLIKAYEADISIEDFMDERDLEKINKDHKKTMRSNIGKLICDGDFEIAAFDITETIDFADFPDTIKFALDNNFADGKKRALFLLLTFLHSIKYDKKHIKTIIEEWNSKQNEPLKPNYLTAQIIWFENQEKLLSPPNYNNSNYYKAIGIDEDLIKKDKSKFKNIKVKNPLHYVYLLIKSKPKEKN